MNKLCIIVSLVMLAAGMQATESKIVAKKQAVYVVQSNLINRSYVCAEGVEVGEIKDGTVHASLLRGDSRYLVIAYSEMSRPGSPYKRCGGGRESYLVWLHVRGSTLVASQSVLFESCWKDIYGGIPAWNGPLLTVEYEDSEYDPDTKTSSSTDYRASFDSRALQKGIEVTKIKRDP